MLTGERPEDNPRSPSGCASYGHADFTSYVVWACERALERGLLPHSNLGVLAREDLARLREVNASMGLMLESVSERLMETVHAGSPTKHPAAAARDDRGRGRAADPVHERHPGRDRRDRGGAVCLARGAGRGACAPRPHPGGDPPELRASPELLRPRGGADRRPRRAQALVRGRDGDAVGDAATRRCPIGRPRSRSRTCGGWCASAARLMPDVGIQIPPNLSDWWLPLVREGATDLGGLSANGDHISPEHPFPSPHQVRKRLAAEGYALTERLCVYPQYIDPDWMAQGVLDTIKLKYWSFIPRRGSGRRSDVAIDAGLAPGAIEQGARRPAADQARADGAVRRAPPGGDRGHAPGRGRDPRAARRRHRHLRGQPQHQLHQHLPGRLRLLRIRPGQALA